MYISMFVYIVFSLCMPRQSSNSFLFAGTVTTNGAFDENSLRMKTETKIVQTKKKQTKNNICCK